VTWRKKAKVKAASANQDTTIRADTHPPVCPTKDGRRSEASSEDTESARTWEWRVKDDIPKIEWPPVDRDGDVPKFSEAIPAWWWLGPLLVLLFLVWIALH
jgi:hypothetical protein